VPKSGSWILIYNQSPLASSFLTANTSVIFNPLQGSNQTQTQAQISSDMFWPRIDSSLHDSSLHNPSWVTFSETQMPFLAVVICVAALLLTWRLWRFKVRPVLRPDEPRELPYWIPCMWMSTMSGFEVIS
jgi:hypothetical protein